MKEADKEKALAEYKTARETYLSDPSDKNWRIFCDCKRVCRLLGVII